MANTESQVRCGECGAEIKNGKCPNCGSSKKLYKKQVGGGTVGIKGILSRTHEFRWSGTAWAILGIFLTLWATIFFGLCSINNLPLWANLLISIGIMGLLFLVIYLIRYQISNILDWLERKFTGKKTYHGNQ